MDERFAGGADCDDQPRRRLLVADDVGNTVWRVTDKAKSAQRN